MDFGGAFGSAVGTGWICNELGTCTTTTSIPAGGTAPILTVKTLPNGRYGVTVSAALSNASDTDHSNDTASVAGGRVLYEWRVAVVLLVPVAGHVICGLCW